MKSLLRYLYIIITLFLIHSCGSSAYTAKIASINSLIESLEFEIEHDWVSPLGGPRIYIMDNPNFIRFKNDSVNLFLPFFGERFSGGGYNNQGGIVYEGPLNNFEILDGDKNTRIIKFRTKQSSETLDFSINIFPEGNVTTRVNSTERSFISYQGRIKELEERDE
ncbi:DUF4251 domain-containing protein [Salegentibacter sp. JZCK2]|uniref:DUF4251 domain-containing protein n=1 Tax=Salegentibacter tibetensis TaxID=2873600 RepID=UPI001CCE72ED|nr:DUF4251 domain-containing protein [Salegentibacter tibetensis]MBZ9729708.1 DUF4251 domain-containing protein [Salegentibacter tibetensis]